MARLLGTALAALLVLTAAGSAGSPSEGDVHEFSRLSMGTRIRLLLVGDDAERAAGVAADAFARLDALEHAMSDWRRDSELAAVDAAAGGVPLVVSDDLARVLRLARRAAELTDGAFDPTVGPLTRLWREARSEGRLPEAAALDHAVTLVNWRNLEVLDRGRVRLRRAGMALDLGGIGKGFAVDRLAELLRGRGFDRFLVDFGSVAIGAGAPPDRTTWRISREGHLPLELRDAAVAFSGGAEQHLEIDGVRHGHILDPRSGAAMTTAVTTAVVASEAAIADALATAACVVGIDAAMAMVDRMEVCAIAIDAPRPEGGWRSVESPNFTAFARGEERGESAALRRARRGEVLALEVAEVRFESQRNGWPPVSLVGVAHIGDASAYARLQAILDAHSGGTDSGTAPTRREGVVLFESVLPDGARPPGGASATERIDSTLATMRLLADELAAVADGNGPQEAVTFRELLERVIVATPRNGPLLRPLVADAWEREFRLDVLPVADANAGGETARWAIISLGADGAVGGEAEDADLRVEFTARRADAGGGLQADLARALGLAYQLEAMDYDRHGWRAADMTASEFIVAARARGADAGPILGTIGGSSFPAAMVRVLLGVIQVADALSGGGVRDTLKALMIEMLAEPDVLQMADAQLGALMEVILQERNQVAIDAMLEAIAEEPTPRSIAIFYGAAHLPDLAERLEAHGYRAVRVEWHPMLTLDLEKSRVDERQLAQLRRMVRQMTAQRR